MSANPLSTTRPVRPATWCRGSRPARCARGRHRRSWRPALICEPGRSACSSCIRAQRLRSVRSSRQRSAMRRIDGQARILSPELKGQLANGNSWSIGELLRCTGSSQPSPCAKRAPHTVTGDNRGSSGNSSKGNETEPGAVLEARSRGTRPGPPRPAPAGGVEAMAVARPVPSGRACLPWGMLAAIDLHGWRAPPARDPGTLRRFVPQPDQRHRHARARPARAGPVRRW